MGLLIYRQTIDEEGNTFYNPVAFKLEDGTVKTTNRRLGNMIKNMELGEIYSEFNNGQTYIVKAYSQDTILRIMKRAK